MPLLTQKGSRKLGNVQNVNDIPLSDGGELVAVDSTNATQNRQTAIANFYSSKVKPFSTLEAGVAEYSLQANGLRDSTNDNLNLVRSTPTQISFQHVATGKTVFFAAFLKGFTETFAPSYSSEDVFGRMDPIMMFQKTTRTISLSWQVPAYSAEESELNLSRLSSLAQFMYPTYKNKGDATLLAKPPLLRIRFGNLIQNANTNAGLLCAVTNFTFSPNVEMGFFMSLPGDEANNGGTTLGLAGSLYPKSVDCSISITVLHEHDVGHKEAIALQTPEAATGQWLGNLDKDGNIVGTEFPWGRHGIEQEKYTNQNTSLTALKQNNKAFLAEVSLVVESVAEPTSADGSPNNPGANVATTSTPKP
jgi:hypothetical protein